MKLNIAKRQERNGVKFFYVTSDTEVDKTYIVVKVGSKFFCQCSDFFARKLPHLGTSTFSLCKHGRFARTEEASGPKYEIWTKPNEGYFSYEFRSGSIPQKFASIRAAQHAIDTFADGSFREHYQVKTASD
jgi:hypothetical protein